MLLVWLEISLLGFVFGEWLLASFLVVMFFWLVYDYFSLPEDGRYDLRQYRLLALAINVSGYASMVYVWWSGVLTALP